MLRFAKHVLIVMLFVIFAGCAGGGCTSGCSCGGITPLAEGFDPARRIENVAAVRLTDSGLSFLSANVGPLAAVLLGDEANGVLNFEIPSASGNLGCFYIGGADYDLCPNGPNPQGNPKECVAEIDLPNANMVITSETPHHLHVGGTLPIRLQKLPVQLNIDLCSPIPTNCSVCTGVTDIGADVTLTGNQQCPDNPANQMFHDLALDVNVSIEIDTDTSHSRYGYSRVRVNINADQDNIEDGLRICTGSDIGDDIINALLGLVSGSIIGPLEDTLNEQVEEALCQQANDELDPPCPTGTTNDGGICRFQDGSCASIVLGLDGNIDLSGLLAGFSPGTKGAFDFLFAVGGHNLRPDASGFHYGDLNPVNNGATFGMYGGWEPTPISGCVTPVNIELPANIPIPDELKENTVAGWPAGMDNPHLGLALSERFTNYLLAQAYNSGALCLGITSDALGDSVPLTSALIGTAVGASSMAELGRQKQPAPLAILIRPNEPPSIQFGTGVDIATDPLIDLTFNRVAFDFYIWSLDRYVRAMTATMDLRVPMNLESTAEGLIPVIEELGITNAEVTNSLLLREDPATIATALQELLGSFVGGFLGDALPAIDLNEQLADLGLGMSVPQAGLTKLTKDTDDFLGIFATLSLAQMNANAAYTSATTAEALAVEIDQAALSPATYTVENRPRVRLRMGSNLDDGSQPIEWQYKVNNGPWHPFTSRREITVSDPWFRIRGRHNVYVRSRVVGEPLTLDPEPAVVEVLVDDDTPQIRVTQDLDGLVHVEAKDQVTENVAVRVRFGEASDSDDAVSWGTWSEWMPAGRMAALDPGAAGFIDVEARDEDGHIGTSRQAIIRGRADGGDCECAASPGHAMPAKAPWLVALLVGLMAFVRRRRPKKKPNGTARVLRHAAAATTLVALAGMSGCSCGDDVVEAQNAGCRARGDCSVLLPGLVGAYTSAATAPDGTVWVSGYLEAAWAGAIENQPWSGDYSYGDLVVGRWDDAMQEVDWIVVDGLPEGVEADKETYDPQGFRRGLVDPGPDVGLWTALAIGDNGQPGVAYYDASNRALKYASFDGSAWQVGVVEQSETGDYGRYAELVFVGGTPVIAYMFIETAANGATTSGVRVARGSAAAAGSATWSFEDVSANPSTPCNPALCPSGTECIIETNTCLTSSTDCAAKCPDGEECVDMGGTPTCLANRGTGTETYPESSGLYVSLASAPNGALGVVWYDRIKGNLWAASNNGGAWAPILVDGESPAGEDTGDKGIGAALAIDQNGDFHIAYVDGLNESLNYRGLQGGSTPTAIEVVDDGLGFGDGQHVVGDDADIVVTQGGEIHVSFQDATSGTLHYAVGTGAAGMHSWDVRVVDQEGFAGAFSVLIEQGGQQKVMNFWRTAAPWSEGNVRLLNP